MQFGRWRQAVLSTVGGLVLVSGGLLHGPHANATVEWCWDDPVVNIGGITLQTLVGVNASPDAVHHGIHTAIVTYTVPAGVPTSVVSTSALYFNERVVFRTADSGTDDSSGDSGRQGTAAWKPGRPIPVTVSVSFNGDSDFAAEMKNVEHGVTVSDASGNTDEGASASFVLH